MTSSVHDFMSRSDYVRVGEKLYVLGKENKDFVERVKKDVAKLGTKEVGKRLLTKIGKGKHIVYISYHPEKHTAQPLDYANSMRRGVGCSTLITYPSIDKEYMGADTKPIPGPSWARFAHEAIHAKNNSYGKSCGMTQERGDKEIWTHDEEIHVIVGFPSKKEEKRTRPKITENAILREHNLPVRFSHIRKGDVFPQLKMTALAQRVVNAAFCECDVFRPKGYDNPPPIAYLSNSKYLR